MDTSSEGHVWIAGAGPGDPGLLTLAAAAALARADVVLYDALASPAVLAHARMGAELLYVGKRAGKHALPQEEIEELLVERAKRGQRVVRLKGGDPFVFGRGGEEALACRRAGVAFTVVPGVSSAVAAAAYAGIPVTHRGLAAGFLVVTGNESGAPGSEVDWAAAARAETLVVLMGVASLEMNMERLQAAGRDAQMPVACIRWGTRADQQVLTGTVGTIGRLAREAGLESPVVTVVGEVVRLREELAWFVPGPLAGRRVVVTRARAQASELAAQLAALGAFVVEAPVIASRREREFTLDERVGSRWDWVVFTSANGVVAFFEALEESGQDARALSTTKVAAVGDATAEALRRRGLRADFAPSRATGEVLAAELPRVPGARIFLPVSALTDNRLAEALRARGGLVEQVAAYTTVFEPLDEERRREVAEADAVTFTSASTARALKQALDGQELPERAKLVSIGKQTSAAVLNAFGRVDREAREPSLASLVEAVREVLTWD